MQQEERKPLKTDINIARIESKIQAKLGREPIVIGPKMVKKFNNMEKRFLMVENRFETSENKQDRVDQVWVLGFSINPYVQY